MHLNNVVTTYKIKPLKAPRARNITSLQLQLQEMTRNLTSGEDCYITALS